MVVPAEDLRPKMMLCANCRWLAEEGEQGASMVQLSVSIQQNQFDALFHPPKSPIPLLPRPAGLHD